MEALLCREKGQQKRNDCRQPDGTTGQKEQERRFSRNKQQ
jgi:hypothetical protein